MSNLLRDSHNDANEVRFAFSSQLLRERVSVDRAETSFNSRSNSGAVDHLPRIYKAKKASGRNRW